MNYYIINYVKLFMQTLRYCRRGIRKKYNTTNCHNVKSLIQGVCVCVLDIWQGVTPFDLDYYVNDFQAKMLNLQILQYLSVMRCVFVFFGRLGIREKKVLLIVHVLHTGLVMADIIFECNIRVKKFPLVGYFYLFIFMLAV